LAAISTAHIFFSYLQKGIPKKARGRKGSAISILGGGTVNKVVKKGAEVGRWILDSLV